MKGKNVSQLGLSRYDSPITSGHRGVAGVESEPVAVAEGAAVGEPETQGDPRPLFDQVVRFLSEKKSEADVV